MFRVDTLFNLVNAYLRPEGYKVYTAADGNAGLKAASAYKPDLIIPDLTLPGMDGIELLTRLRRESDAYLIMLTAPAGAGLSGERTVLALQHVHIDIREQEENNLWLLS